MNRRNLNTELRDLQDEEELTWLEVELQKPEIHVLREERAEEEVET